MLAKRLTLLLTLLLLCSSAFAGRYRQPAYITNAYFTNEAKDADGFLQPDKVINVARANRKDLTGHFVLNLVADKGKHQIEIDLLDSSGKKFGGISVEATVADRDNFPYTVVGEYGGEMPVGGVFFKVYDRHNSAKRKEIGTFRLLTFK